MEQIDLQQLLEQVQQGKIDVVSAISRVGGNIKDCGSAKLDFDREQRCGFPEFIYGAGKSIEQLLEIIPAIIANNQPVLATRIDAEKAAAILEQHPEAEYDSQAKTIIIRQKSLPQKTGKLLILTAGTSDLGVALEAKYTAELCGVTTELVADAGVAGLHRLLTATNQLQKADVIIVVAGMEGALPSVVGGLVKCPVIAVPTSVGYGAALNGFTALLGMLTSCASGVSVVNIDNGFGAACAAVRMLGLKK
jgi:pyridinium-3,5-biscarboxylic acid mononucleotide synthase